MTSEVFDIIRFAVLIIVLVSASVSDLRTREVSDAHWMVLGAFGVICMTYSAFDHGITIGNAMMIAGTVMALVSILFDVEKGKAVTLLYYGVLALLFIVPIVTSWDDGLIREFATVPVAFVIFLGLFFTGVIKGGADVKCLIVIAMVFQTYPQFLGLPIIGLPEVDVTLLIQFTFAIFFHAALFSLAVVFLNVAKNLRNKERMSASMFSGYSMPVDDVPGSHVWLLDKVEDGVVVTTRSIQGPETIDELKGAGAVMVRVTPMIPFLVPITAAVIFLALIGNILFIPFI